ncbi:MAG: TrmB family transcriptional regulator sugar-binding domain-containing protein [Candidatus Methanofastidiosia archaeon]
MADIIVNRRSFKQLPRMTRDFMKRASSEIDIITRSFTWADDETMEAMYALINKGVRINIVGKYGDESRDIIRQLIKLGATVKLHEFAGEARFMIIDEKEVVFAIREPLTPTERHYVGILMKDESTSRTVKQYVFDAIFKEAEEASYVVS